MSYAKKRRKTKKKVILDGKKKKEKKKWNDIMISIRMRDQDGIPTC